MKVLSYPSRGIVMGEDALAYLKELPFKKAIVVIDPYFMENGTTKATVTEYLSGDGRALEFYSNVSPNPTKAEVLKGLEGMKSFLPDMVVAVGGGSVIDCAKCMTLFYEFPELNFDNVLKAEKPLTKKTIFAAVPTTSGTGSEASPITVISNEDTGEKIVIRAAALMPEYAVLDTSLTLSMPPKVVADTGLDALTHAIECYINRRIDDISESLAQGCIVGLMKWLPISYDNGDVESRGKVHNFQCMAGMAQSNVGLGIVHGISNGYVAQYHYGHGFTNAVLLPYCLAYNKQDATVKERLDTLSKACGCDDIIAEICKLKAKVGLPASFKEYGLDEETFKKDFQTIVDGSMFNSTLVNPIPMTKEEVAKVVKAAYYGETTEYAYPY